MVPSLGTVNTSTYGHSVNGLPSSSVIVPVMVAKLAGDGEKSMSATVTPFTIVTGAASFLEVSWS